MESLIGQQWGSYQLIRLLGRGGFAHVYLGKHVRLDMFAAVKIVHTTLSEKVARSFEQEARIIADLAHPHIVRVLDFDVQNEKPFLVMEYAPHGSLNQKHPRGTQIPLSTIVEYINQVASALSYAHEKKLIHRDVKPENMLLGRRDDLLLSDFGIATIAHSTISMNTQEAPGTLLYMAPEQIQGHPRAASDQYALGIVIYQWLTGKTPFRGSASEIVAQHLGIMPPPLHTFLPQISGEIGEVIQKSLAKDPKERFGSVLEFAQALERAANSPRDVSAVSDLSAALPPLLLAPEIRSSVPEIAPAASLKNRQTVTMFTGKPSDLSPAIPREEFLAVSTPAPPANSITPLPALPADISHPASDAILADEQRIETPLPAMAAWQGIPITPLPAPRRPASRRHNRRIIALLIATVFFLIAGSLAFWIFALPSLRSVSLIHPTRAGTPLSSPGTSTSVNTVIPSGQPGQSGTQPGGATPGPGQNHPTGQPGASVTPASSSTPSSSGTGTPSVSGTPPPQMTPTSAANCLHGDKNGVTVTQILGLSASLPGQAVALTNCSPADGSWTATIQIDNGSGWISCNPQSADIPAGSSQTVHLIIGGPNVLLGTYTARVAFTMNNATWTVSVTLIIVA